MSTEREELANDASPSEKLRWLGEARMEYFHAAPPKTASDIAQLSTSDAGIYWQGQAADQLARILEGEPSEAWGWLPSWKWDEWEKIQAGFRKQDPVSKPTGAEVEAGARAAAILGDYDGCFERLDRWRTATAEQRECGEVEEPMSTDEDDAEFWRDRVRAALVAARAVIARRTTDEPS